MLNSDQKVQGSDTTGDDSSSVAGQIIISQLIINSPLTTYYTTPLKILPSQL